MVEQILERTHQQLADAMITLHEAAKEQCEAQGVSFEEWFLRRFTTTIVVAPEQPDPTQMKYIVRWRLRR